MNNQIPVGNKGNYILAAQLGRGGEGTVFEVNNHPNLVVKIYNENITQERESKLKYMVQLGRNEITNFSAWPLDILYLKGKPIGFAMKKLDGFVHLHKVYMPFDRKNLFPARGNNFLIHVATNLAKAFSSLNNQNIIVGDVNESNILVNKDGIVNFIDCDSFQIKFNNQYYFCEVGVTRYTPPELLMKGSFENVVRTCNTDSFSLAILIFQLLFLGRHPFAGINKSNIEIDEEYAIKNGYFAYSLNNKNNLLHPPIDSLPIANITKGLTTLFHRAFETQNRPTSLEWIKELDDYSRNQKICTKSPTHIYYNQILKCPWCEFLATKGISFFVDDSMQRQNIILDINTFINGYRAEPLQINKIHDSYTFYHAAPDTIPKEFINYKKYKKNAIYVYLAFIVAIMFIKLWLFLPGIFVVSIFSGLLPYANKLNQEQNKRRGYHLLLKNKYKDLILLFNQNLDISNYNRNLISFQKLVESIKRLPSELDSGKKKIEENHYTLKLHEYLKNYKLKDIQIDSFGPVKHESLRNSGIITVSDISKLRNMNVRGIGYTYENILFSLQRKYISRFTYVPDINLINREINIITNEYNQKYKYQANIIKFEFNKLNNEKGEIYNKRKKIKEEIDDLGPKVLKSELEMNSFDAFLKN
ncbi:MAG: protein kinase [Saprospiraceae bacterium]